MPRLVELKDLIQSLTQGEKRHLGRLTYDSEKAGGTQQQMLYEFLLAMPNGSNDELKEGLAQAGLTKNLATLIPRLDQHIMKCLTHLNPGQHVDGQLYQALSEIKILYDKHLWDKGMRTIRRAQNLAKEYSRVNVLLELLTWKRRFWVEENSPRLQTDLDAIQLEEQRLLDQFRLQTALHHLQTLARQLARKRPSKEADSDKINACWDQALFDLAAKTDDHLSIVISGNVQGIVHIMRQEFDKAYEVYLPLVRFWEARPKWVEDQAELLLMVFNNFHLAAMMASSDLAPLEHFMSLIRAFRFQDPVLKFRIQRISYLQDFVYCLNFARFERGIRLAEKLEEWLPTAKNYLSHAQWLTFHYNLLVFHFITGNFSAANRFALHIRRSTPNDFRRDIQDFSRLMHFLIQFEIGHLDQCERIARNSRRYFKQDRPADSVYAAVMATLERLLKATPGKERIEWLSEFENRLTEKTPFLGREELLLWVKAQRTSTTIEFQFKLRVKEARMGG